MLAVLPEVPRRWWLRLLACIVCVVIDRAADVAVGSLHLAVTWCVGAAEHPCVQASVLWCVSHVCAGMFWKPGARLGCEVSVALFHHHSGVCATVRQLFHRGRHGCVRAFWQDKFAVQGVDGRCMV